MLKEASLLFTKLARTLGFCVFPFFLGISFPGDEVLSSTDDSLINERFVIQETSHEVGYNLFGSINVTHYTDTYYDRDNFLLCQTPAIHIQGGLGANLYRGKLNIFASFGVIKLPQTLKLIEKRPEIMARYLPLSGEHGEILFYGALMLPFSEGDIDQENSVAEKQGTIFIPGIAPLFKSSIDQSFVKWTFFTGVEGYTKMYSRRQYINEKDEFDSSDKYFLTAYENGEAKEDTILPFYSKVKMGVEISPIWKDQVFLETSATIFQAQKPKYKYEGEQVQYSYSREINSYFKFRIKLIPMERFSLANDFYAYHGGLFEKRMYGDLPRYRNMLHLDYIL